MLDLVIRIVRSAARRVAVKGAMAVRSISLYRRLFQYYPAATPQYRSMGLRHFADSSRVIWYDDRSTSGGLK
jgi:hypothetical protein